MESTFYTAKEAAAFLEVTESEIYQLVLVKKLLRPIIFFNTPPPFLESSYVFIETEDKYSEIYEYNSPIADGELCGMSIDSEHELIFGYISTESLIETKWPADHVLERYYVLMQNDNNEVTAKSLGPISIEDKNGNKIEFHFRSTRITDDIVTHFFVQSKYLFIPETVNWIFTVTELKRIKYNKPKCESNSDDVPKMGQLLTQRSELIVEELRRLGFDPKSLVRKRGKSGPKAMVRDRLLASHPEFFPNENKFKDAWKHASEKQIKYKNQ